MLTLPAAGTSSYWQRLGCTALLLERHCEQSRFSEREVAVLCLVQVFLKMSKQSTLDSFDTELFVTEREQLPTIWDSRSFVRATNKQTKNYAWERLREIY